LPLPPFTPAAPANIRDAFDHEDYIFELKMDGFRALAHVGPDETRLVSRRRNVYKRFTELAAAIHIELDCEAVFDGEIVCLDTKVGHTSTICSVAAVRPCSTRSICCRSMGKTCDRAR
jgi:bifunctional non-homologous end joining protein LigD